MLKSNLLFVEGSLKRQRRINRERHKSIRFNQYAKQQLGTFSTLFLHFFPSLHDYDVKPQCLISCFVEEHKPTTFFFFSWTLIQSYFEFNSGKICQIERDGISASGIFKSDVFVAVAVVVAYQPPIFTRAGVLKSLFFDFSCPSRLFLVLMNSVSGKSTLILNFLRVGIIATAFGRTQIHSKGEIFAASPLSSLKAPYANSPSSLSALSTSEKYQFRFPICWR